MHKIRLTGIITIWSDEIYDKVVKLAEEDELFALISDLLHTNFSTKQVLDKLDTILEEIKKAPVVPFKDKDEIKPIIQNNECVAEIKKVMPPSTGSVATLLGKMSKMKKR